MTRPRITCDGADITEQVAAMYDAIIGSLDWGSEFLDDETVEAILLVGEAAGFELAAPPEGILRGAGFDEPAPVFPTYRGPPGADPPPEFFTERENYMVAVAQWRARRIEHWHRQHRAKLAAKLAELRGEP